MPLSWYLLHLFKGDNVSVTQAGTKKFIQIGVSFILTFTCATIIYYCSAEALPHDTDTFVSLLYGMMQWNLNHFRNPNHAPRVTLT